MDLRWSGAALKSEESDVRRGGTCAEGGKEGGREGEGEGEGGI